MKHMRTDKPKTVKSFEITLETEDPEYVNEAWLKYVLNDAFMGPEFHEPEGDHPPRLLSVKQRRFTTDMPFAARPAILRPLVAE